jgi:hypothetical protein
LNTHYLL